VLLSRGGIETVKIELKEKTDSFAGGWAPPENPDPSKILREVKEDTRSRNYKTALAKQIWYYENALRIQPSQSGVRLSSGMNNWLELGEKYPPALAKMREARDATEVRIRDKNRIRVKFEDFQAFRAFNRTLREEQRTAKLFMWLDEVDPEDAARVYPISEAALIKQEEYKICGKYIDPTKNVRQIFESYKMGLEMSVKFGEEYLRYTEKSFVDASATLIEILVKNDRKAEAQEVAKRLKKHVEGNDISTKLEKAIGVAMEHRPHAESSEFPAESKMKEINLTAPVAETWTPPENPDPSKILSEAQQDKRSGNYQRALEKHLWYHENALRIEPSQLGVRTSFALGSWLELGEKYLPALAKMKEIRDSLEAKLRDENCVRTETSDFADFKAFNRTLRQEEQTAELFIWLDKVDPKYAARVYHRAEPALLKQKEYEICGRYAEPSKKIKRICDSYDRGIKMSSKFGESHLDYVKTKFVEDSATLIEILVQNDRQAEAQETAIKLKRFAEGKDISAHLENALTAALKAKQKM
jgi:hypothetical protein